MSENSPPPSLRAHFPMLDNAHATTGLSSSLSPCPSILLKVPRLWKHSGPDDSRSTGRIHLLRDCGWIRELCRRKLREGLMANIKCPKCSNQAPVEILNPETIQVRCACGFISPEMIQRDGKWIDKKPKAKLRLVSSREKKRAPGVSFVIGKNSDDYE